MYDGVCVCVKVETEHGDVVVGTSHLESPVPPFNGASMMTRQRKDQLQQALRWCEPVMIGNTLLQIGRCPFTIVLGP
jgi:hypothetical protein